MKRDFLTPKELAAKWNLKIGTLADWRYVGVGPVFEKIGWSVVYPLKEISAYEKRYPKFKARSTPPPSA